MSKRTYIGLFVIVGALALLLIPLQGGVHAVQAVSGPSAMVWNFAEGRVGGNGFRQWLTVANPSDISCDVKVDYFYTMDGSTSTQMKTVKFTVGALTRHTQNVNNDLGVSPNASGATLSAKVYVDQGATPTCPGVIAERPMYFNDYHNVSSGTDVLGMTDSQLKTDYYFADVPTHSAGTSFISILNPGDILAHVTIDYYGNNGYKKTDTLDVAPKSRGTFQPGNIVDLPAHVSAHVHSDRSIMVERPSYITNINGVSGSADLTGATSPAAHWMFADGLTNSGSHTTLTLANFGATDATVTITLKDLNGVSHPYTETVQANSQLISDVNAHNNNSTSEVSIDVAAATATAQLVVQRQIYSTSATNGFSYQGVTDVMGVNAAKSSLSYAEGFTSVGFDQQLALYNPDPNNAAKVDITLVNMLGHTTTQTVTVKAHSRDTVNVTQMVKDHLAQSDDGADAYAISMVVNSDHPVVSERVMHWNAFSTQGSTDVTGYTV